MTFKNLRLKEICSVLSYRPSIMRWTACNRKDHIIGFQLCGKALHVMKNQKIEMSENCVFFLNQKDDYSVEVYEAGEALSIHFTTYEDIETDSFCVPIQNSREIVSVLKKAESSKALGNELKLRSLFYEVCDILEKSHLRVYAPKDKRMLTAKAYIDQHFTEPDCISDAVSESGLGDRRFRDLFKTAFNTTPNRYLTLKKTEYAKELLSAGGLSVTEVSKRSGFSDIYYFSKVFKRIYDVAPSEW